MIDFVQRMALGEISRQKKIGEKLQYLQFHFNRHFCIRFQMFAFLTTRLTCLSKIKGYAQIVEITTFLNGGNFEVNNVGCGGAE